MTEREAAIVSAYTGYLIGDFDRLRAYVQEKAGRPVKLHELSGVTEPVMTNPIYRKIKADFLTIEVTP